MNRLTKLSCLALLLAAPALAPAAEPPLVKGDTVAIIGDSITEQKLYSLYIEDYLLMCRPEFGLRTTQFGWGGETAPGFANRMANDCLRFKPSVITTCFGMNDGGYSPMDPAKAKRYHDGQASIVQQAKKAGVRYIVVGSPGVVDADTFRHDAAAATIYNKTLAEERDIAKAVAAEEGVAFANVFDPMMEAMTKAKAKYGKDYHVAGGDGVHPDRNGHLVMAYAFLKALGCDGDIGTITVDLAGGKAEASAGHKVLSFKDGSVEIESSRYPFCFSGDPKSPSGTAGITEFFPFNEELNRFVLVVKGVPAEAKVTIAWGEVTKDFTGAQLAKGINLAAEFAAGNPFSKPFAEVEGKIGNQQNLETHLVKNLLHNLPQYAEFAPAEKATFERITDALVKKGFEVRDASAAAVVPVKHTLKVSIAK
jgi:lysophospholipase L1-like esterase